jgi:hypothetical protein
MDFDYLMPIRSPVRAWEVFWAEFEAMWEHRGLWIAVWHPMASGRLARWAETERMIEAILKKGQVWFATLEEIACHVNACIADETWRPRVDSLPYYAGPVSLFGPGSASH